MYAKRRKYCKFTEEGITTIDYKDIALLKSFVMEAGRIIPSRVTGTKPRYQRMLARKIALARFLAFLPYTDRH